MNSYELRHRLHQTPELMLEEYKTTEIILEALGDLENIKIHRPVETGLLAEYTVNDGGYILLRADIDALPLAEETGWTYRSLNGCMHACGHDVHSAILFEVIKRVVKDKPGRNMLFLFQPGEEGGGGAAKIIESGILNQFNIINAFALHVTDEYPFGTIASTPGVLFASAHEVDLEIYGKSAHVAFPENGIHAFDALRKFLDKVDELVAGKEERIIFGYGRVISGSVRNIIPALARAECTIRSGNMEKSLEFRNELETILKGLSSSTGVKYMLHKGPLYSEVLVNGSLYEKCRELLSAEHIFIDCGMKMTGEDFGLFTKLYPSFMFWLGTSKGEHHGLHTPLFLPDDSAIDLGADILYKIAISS